MISRYLPAKTILFEQTKNGTTYRIPALLHLPASGTLLAFAEERHSPADVDATVLVVRRGELSRNRVEWGAMEVVGSALLPGHRSMNPCPVYDGSTDTIFLFFIAIPSKVSEAHQLQTGDNVTRFCCVSSSDRGGSWSGPSDLTEATLGRCLQDWATFGLGPGHGIQLRCGRLLLPAYAYRIDAKDCFGRRCKTSPHSFAFYSDDHGQRWRAGELLGGPQTVECQLVSLDEGSGQAAVYCNARTLGTCRVQALSLHRGAAFQEGRPVPKLPETRGGCHGSMVGFPGLVPGRAKESGTSDHSSSPELPPGLPAATWALFCHPTSPTARLHLGLYLSASPPDPHAWSEPWVIHRGPSAYSDLAYVEPGAVGQEHHPSPAAFACLYECGVVTPHETIAFSLLTVRELMHNIPHSPGNSQDLSTAARTACCCVT